MSAFVDTSCLIAFLNRKDPDHAEARRLMQTAGQGALGHLLTSDYVYDEAATLAQRRFDRAMVLDVDAWFRQAWITVIRVAPEEFDLARDRFLQRVGGGLSLTDWTIVVQCERRRVGTILSFDRGFDGLYPRNTVPRR